MAIEYRVHIFSSFENEADRDMFYNEIKNIIAGSNLDVTKCKSFVFNTFQEDTIDQPINLRTTVEGISINNRKGKTIEEIRKTIINI